MVVTQISVFLENKSGRLAELTEALAEAGINIRALSVAETVDYGVLRMIVDNPDLACERLRQTGFTVTETPVLALEIPDRPGGLAYVIRVLSDAGINVEYVYAFVGKAQENAIVVLRLEEIERAVELLGKRGIEAVPAEKVYRM
ncbi:MAG: ACT domain-containing protein [bacterium]|nr:ACT domain-containing protein [bacterium]